MATPDQERFRICRTVANAIMIISNECAASSESILELISERIGCDKDDKALISKHFESQSCVDSFEYISYKIRGNANERHRKRSG